MGNSEAPGVIEPGQVYVAEEARKRLRLGPQSWKKLRDAGLKITRHGRQAFVRGDDLIRALFKDEAPQ